MNVILFSHGVKMPRLQPVELTQHEIQGLLKAFLKGKHEVDEEDCLVLVKWAHATRMRNFVLSRMIAGAIQPSVEATKSKWRCPRRGTADVYLWG
jgi:hypothetical protein